MENFLTTFGSRGEFEKAVKALDAAGSREIFKRLPGTNCGACGESTCLAFAVKVHAGEMPVTRCDAVFRGGYSRLRDALVQICRGMEVVP